MLWRGFFFLPGCGKKFIVWGRHLLQVSVYEGKQTYVQDSWTSRQKAWIRTDLYMYRADLSGLGSTAIFKGSELIPSSRENSGFWFEMLLKS